LHQHWTVNHFFIAVWSAKEAQSATMKTLIKIPIPSFFIALILALTCGVGLLPKAGAVSPPPDGAYPNFTTAEGQHALQDLTSGAGNTALGAYSMFSTTTGSFNTGVGAGALDLNTGDKNTAVGAAALLLNTGTQNTAVGVDALALNTSGGPNTAVGAFALFNNTASGNTAMGAAALSSNTTGDDNTAIGDSALGDNTTGDTNAAVGFHALFLNTTGGENTAVGTGALRNNTTGGSNIAIGLAAGLSITTTSNNIDIGNQGVAGDSNTIRVGDSQTTTFVAGIRGVTTDIADAIPVLIDSNNQLGTMSSSRRFKKEISPMDKVSEAILALRPVTFHYKSDKTDTPQFGLVAEEVAKVNPNLVVRDKDGEIYTVRYDAVNAMLLNEFLKAHHKIEELEASNAQQQKQIEALTAGLQKVSAQLSTSKPAPQVAENNQ
jgi:hypothetical protein